jgi:O-antigen/teichoic acid export membrane protein
VLKTLGVIDYGIYNVVGGIVMMFAFISSTMGAASQRFLSFELGKRNYEQLKHIFSLTVLSYIFIAILIFVLSETIGLWFFYNKMNIPNSRMDAAFWVYQFSIFSFIFTIIAIPYNAVIIAREKMNVYAYLSILDSILKLLIIYLLVFISFDKLKLYAVLMFIIYACDFIFYFVYCRFKFEECSYNFIWDWNKLKEMLLYAWWGMIGAIANVFKNQGSNILLNIFFGPAVNASRGISFQIKNAIMNFNNNFFMAVRPAIVKEYAAGNQDEMIKLIYRSTKISYFLMLGLSMPVLIETHFILKFWLGQLPEYVVIFTRLVIIDSLFDTLVLPIASMPHEMYQQPAFPIRRSISSSTKSTRLLQVQRTFGPSRINSSHSRITCSRFTVKRSAYMWTL